jgi:hypothetical protein
MYNADTLAPVPVNGGVFQHQGAAGLQWPKGIAAYKGEVFVSDSSGIKVYDADGNYKRTLESVFGGWTGFALGGSFTSIDVAWGEVWARLYSVRTGPALVALDAQTGAMKAWIPIGDGAPAACPVYVVSCIPGNPYTQQDVGVYGPCALGYQPPCQDLNTYPTATTYQQMRYDVATAPDINAIFTGYETVTRSGLYDLLSSDSGTGLGYVSDPCYPVHYSNPEEPPNSTRGDPMGSTAVWGAKTLLTIDNCQHAYFNTRSLVHVLPIGRDTITGQFAGINGGDNPWVPADSTTDTFRDVAYRSHEPRITWLDGNLADKTTWMTNNQCVRYVVTDGDYYIVGMRGERWYSIARGFTPPVRLYLDDVDPDRTTPLTLTSGDPTQPTDTLCVDMRRPYGANPPAGLPGTLPSGTHRLTMTATVTGNQLTQTNPALHVDNDPPTGTLNSLPAATNAPLVASGTLSDADAGPATWHLQVNGPGTGGKFQTVCSDNSPDPGTDNWGCRWNTGAYQEGTYQVQAFLEDQVRPSHGGPNTRSVGSAQVIVDRTAPSLGNFAPSLDQPGYESVDTNEEPVMWTQSDDRSGIANTSIEVNDAIDGSDAGSWRVIGTSAASGEAQFTWDTTAVPSGLHRFRATTTDRAGNRTQPQWQAILSNARPNAPDLCPSCARWYAGAHAGTGPYFYSWGAKAQFRTPEQAPAVEAPVTYAGDTSRRTRPARPGSGSVTRVSAQGGTKGVS